MTQAERNAALLDWIANPEPAPIPEPAPTK